MHFKPIKEIRMFHHFQLSSVRPGIVVRNQTVDGSETERSILKTSREDVAMAAYPPLFPLLGSHLNMQHTCTSTSVCTCLLLSRMTCPPPDVVVEDPDEEDADA